MTRLKFLIVALVLSGLSGIALADNVVATVNGKKITEKQLDQYMKYVQSRTKQDISHDKKQVLNELINRELLMAQVKKQKVDKDPELNYAIKQQTIDFYIRTMLGKSDIAKPIPDDVIKKVYDERVKGQKLKEYKLSHIVTKSEQDAKNAIAKLDAGADFSDVAKKLSVGPTASRGGELGWLGAAQLNNMPAIAQAVADLKKGKYTKQPLKSENGWHVIKLEDTREEEPPSLEDMRPRISAALHQQMIDQYVKKLRDEAKVDIKLK